MKPVQFNPFLEKLRGSFGDVVFRRYGDRTFISHKPDMSHIEPSTTQIALRDRFRQAVLYGQSVLADPVLAQPYRLAADRVGKRAFVLAVGDFMAAPVIEAVELLAYTGRPGDNILIRAHDDFGVTAVCLRLTDASGADIELGLACQEIPGHGPWLYRVAAAVAPGTLVRVQVTASDRPGNCAELTVEKTL